MTLNNVVIALFCIMMVLNVVALVRHYLMMRIMIASMRGFMESNRQFNEALDLAYKERPSRTPRPPGSS
jgi:hypothetical protein